MIFYTGFLLAVMLSWSHAAGDGSHEEIPLVIAASSSDAKISNLLPELDEPDVPALTSAQSPISRGRSDIEIEDEEQQPPRGYFYPKPAKPFNLPEFKTLDADAPLHGAAFFAEEDTTEVERLPRSPQRRPAPPFVFPNNFRPRPPFVPGFIPPNNIRPLPALYGRPASSVVLHRNRLTSS